MSNEHYIDWSRRIAELVVDALVTAKIVENADLDRAVAVAEEEIRVRLVIGDRPDPRS
jgi:hypothetical protein